MEHLIALWILVTLWASHCLRWPTLCVGVSPLTTLPCQGDSVPWGHLSLWRQHSVYGMHISLNTSTYLSNNNDNNVLNISTFNLCTVKFTLRVFCDFLTNAYSYVTTTEFNSFRATFPTPENLCINSFISLSSVNIAFVSLASLLYLVQFQCVLNRSGERGHSCLVPSCKEKA